MQNELERVSVAIDAGQKAQARRLLGPILQEAPSAQAWEMAARVMENDQQTVICLRKALEHDPNHATAQQLLTLLDPNGQIQTDKSGDALLRELDLLPRQATEQADPASDKADAGNVYEMLWDCQFCGTKKLLGKTHRFCPNCGSPQDPSWRYFPADDEKVAVKDHHYVGVDVTCPNCGNLNAADAEFCGRCGAPQTDAAKAKIQESRIRGEGGRFNREDLQARLHQEADTAVGRISPQAQAKTWRTARNRTRNWIILAVILAIIGGVAFVFTRTQDVTVSVVDHRWERTIEVQQLRAIDDSSDCDSVPREAYSIDERYEQVGSRSVPDGESCSVRQIDQGDGTFRQERVCETTYRQEPVYDYVCYYTVNRWMDTRVAESIGSLNDPVEWPALSLQSGSSVGAEREGQRFEEYLLILENTANGRTYECEVAPGEWEDTPLNTQFNLQVNAVTQSPRCSTLIRP